MDKQIRILHVIGQMNRGGAESMIMNIYRKIDKDKIQFDFVVHTDDICAFDEEILTLGGKIYRCPRFKGTNILTYKKFWNEFFKKHKEYKIIHGHIGSSAAIYLNIAQKYGLFTIAHSHSAGFGDGTKGAMYRLFSYPTRFIADYFFACSQNAGESRYGKKVTEEKSKFSVLNNAIDVDKYVFSESIRNKKAKELNLQGKFVIGHVGRFDKAKNQSYLIDVFKLISEKNENAVLLLVGDGVLKQSIVEKVKKYNLSDKVIFTGVRNDVNELMQVMDVFVFPSIYEGLPVTIIEAQASGLPCLISDTITNEVCVTQLVEKVSINMNHQEWEIRINQIKYKRENQSEVIKSCGYDINTTVGELEKFYFDNYKI